MFSPLGEHARRGGPASRERPRDFAANNRLRRLPVVVVAATQPRSTTKAVVPVFATSPAEAPLDVATWREAAGQVPAAGRAREMPCSQLASSQDVHLGRTKPTRHSELTSFEHGPRFEPAQPENASETRAHARAAVNELLLRHDTTRVGRRPCPVVGPFPPLGPSERCRGWDKRQASIVEPMKMIPLWEGVGQSWLVVHDRAQLALWVRLGGNALVEVGLAQKWLAPTIAIREVAPDGPTGFLAAESLSDRQLARRPSGKVRMRILERDEHMCRRCGRNTVVLTRHHVLPRSARRADPREQPHNPLR